MTKWEQNADPKFVQWCREIAMANERRPKQIYELWRDYSRDCQAFDQSPIKSEFLRWHNFKEGQFHGTTCCAIEARK